MVYHLTAGRLCGREAFLWRNSLTAFTKIADVTKIYLQTTLLMLLALSHVKL